MNETLEHVLWVAPSYYTIDCSSEILIFVSILFFVGFVIGDPLIIHIYNTISIVNTVQ